MPQSLYEINELFQYSAVGGALGAFAKSLKKNSLRQALVDGFIGGSLTLSVVGILYYLFEPPYWLLCFASGFIGMTAEFMVMWCQRLTGSLLFWLERYIWKGYDSGKDGDPPRME